MKENIHMKKFILFKEHLYTNREVNMLKSSGQRFLSKYLLFKYNIHKGTKPKSSYQNQKFASTFSSLPVSVLEPVSGNFDLPR